MNRKHLLERLELLELRMAAADRNIRRQHQAIVVLERAGEDTRHARALLDRFEQERQGHGDERARILSQLAAERGAMQPR